MKDPAVQNEAYSTSRSNRPKPVAVLGTLEWCAMMRCFTSPDQASDRPTNRRRVNAHGSVRDKRDEQLERAGYLLVIHTHRLIRAIAAFALRIAGSTMRWREMRARPSASSAAGAAISSVDVNALQRCLDRRSKRRADDDIFRDHPDEGGECLAAVALVGNRLGYL